jgi:glycosyltransferase involved in cell wall biosynthesis
MGGIERHTVTLANAFDMLGHDVHVLSMKRRYTIRPRDGVTVHFFDMDRIFRFTGIGLVYDLITRGLLAPLIRRSGFFWRSMYCNFMFRYFISRVEKRSGRFDHIIFMGQGAFENVWSFKDERACRVIVSPVDTPKHNRLESFYTRLLYADTNLVAISSGVNDSLENRLEAYSCKSKSIRLIPNPIPVAEIQRLADEPVSSLPDKPYLVHVARLTYQKNQHLLIEAYHRAGVSEKLVIVGAGQDEAELKKLVKRLGIENKVLFVGQQVNPFPWMKHAKAFILSSRYEGFGLVLAESMTCGTQVVAVDCPGGIRDVLIEEQSRLIAEPTVDGLAAKIVEALERPVSIKPEWYQRYDAEVIAAKFLE